MLWEEETTIEEQQLVYMITQLYPVAAEPKGVLLPKTLQDFIEKYNELF